MNPNPTSIHKDLGGTNGGKQKHQLDFWRVASVVDVDVVVVVVAVSAISLL